MNIFYVPISGSWSAADTFLLRFVSGERQLKINRYIRAMDKRLSLYAALLTRMQISKLTGIPASELKFYAEANHKPELCGIGGIDFSFAHTGGAVLLGIAVNSWVGVDIERLDTAPLEAMEMIFHAEEIQYINREPPAGKGERFLEVWTRKEAYTKRLGTGLVCNLTQCNTCSDSILKTIRTWKQDGYLCSVSSNIAFRKNLTVLTETDIQNFYGVFR